MLKSTHAIVVLLAVAGTGHAAELSPYFDASANQKPRGNAGLAVNSDRVRLTADLAMRGQRGSTEIVPNLSSAFAISPQLGIETHVDLAEWNSHTSLLEAKVDTRLRYQPAAPFLDKLEGRVWRSPDGQSGHVFALAFHQTLGATGRESPITIRGKAIVETTHLGPATNVAMTASAEQSRRVGLETEIRGLLSSWVSGNGALRLKIERLGGAHVETARSVVYDYSWKVRDIAQMGLNLGVRRATQSALEVVEPSFGLTWRAEF